jgi:hypothetical protein
VLRVRNTKKPQSSKRVERRGGLSEDQSKSLDLAHSNSEATLGRPPMHIRERIGPSGFDVNMHIIEKII